MTREETLILTADMWNLIVHKKITKRVALALLGFKPKEFYSDCPCCSYVISHRSDESLAPDRFYGIYDGDCKRCPLINLWSKYLDYDEEDGFEATCAYCEAGITPFTTYMSKHFIMGHDHEAFESAIEIRDYAIKELEWIYRHWPVA